MEGQKPTFNGYEEMYKTFYPVIYRYVARIIRNNESAAEDVTQEVFFVAYQKWEILKLHPNIPGFLMLAAQNKIKKWFEKQKWFCMDEEEELDQLIQKKCGDAQDAYRMVDFYSSVENMLSGKELEILRHYYEYGYSSAEMAQKLGISESCFKVRVSRMKKKLKRSMKLTCAFALMCGAWMLCYLG